MGIQTNLATTTGVTYSVNGSPFEPYNPALILGGLENGVTPLEMAHAYETLAHDGQIVSGTMADSPERPIGIQRVDDANGNPVETNNGDPGQDRVETKQVISPTVAATARGHAPQRRHLRNRYRTPTTATRISWGRPARPRTTATPGSSAPTKTSPSPSGSATPTR